MTRTFGEEVSELCHERAHSLAITAQKRDEWQAAIRQGASSGDHLTDVCLLWTTQDPFGLREQLRMFNDSLRASVGRLVVFQGHQYHVSPDDMSGITPPFTISYARSAYVAVGRLSGGLTVQRERRLQGRQSLELWLGIDSGEGLLQAHSTPNERFHQFTYRHADHIVLCESTHLDRSMDSTYRFFNRGLEMQTVTVGDDSAREVLRELGAGDVVSGMESIAGMYHYLKGV